jgi:hypothetical protein
MTTNNNSDTKITGVQVSLVAMATTLAPTISAPDYVHKQHTLLSEYFYLSIPKQARDHHDILKFDIPSSIVPTFTNKLGKYIDIAYQVNIDIPNCTTTSNTGSGIFGGATDNANTISLPITIATVPPSYPIQVTVHESTDELPTFIPNIESPLPSPVNYPADRAYSVSPSNSFQMRDDFDLEVEDFMLNAHTQDASGHLMVPDNNGARRKSSSTDVSDASTLGTNTITRLETVS